MTVAAEQFCVGGGRLSAAVLALVVVHVAAVALAGLLLDGLTYSNKLMVHALFVSHILACYHQFRGRLRALVLLQGNEPRSLTLIRTSLYYPL